MFRWDIINLQIPPNIHGIEPIAFIGDQGNYISLNLGFLEQ